MVGIDGGVGLPGYSGMAPTTMLTQSLVLVRDLLLSGSPSTALGKAPGKGESPTWKGPGELPAPWKPNPIKRLQPNVRAVLAEMELLTGLTFTPAAKPDLPAPSKRQAVLKAGNTTVVTITAPSREVFLRQLVSVASFADLRGERVNEVLSQVVPQTAYWSAIAGLSPERHRYTWELLGIGLRFAMMVVMRFKAMLECPRPSEYSALIQPMILPPGYSTFPSGHATEGYFAAEMLHLLIGDAAKRPDKYSSIRGQLFRLAYRVSENRVVAGLHFPIDSVAGQMLGVMLARYFMQRSGLVTTSGIGGSFNALPMSEEVLARMEPKLDVQDPDDPLLGFEMPKPTPTVEPGDAPVLQALRQWAEEEWKE